MNEYELYHHGIKGMKWGVRRYQNADGSLTSAGKSRYNTNKMLVRNESAAAKSSAEKSRKTAQAYYDSASKMRKDGKSALDRKYGKTMSDDEKQAAVDIASKKREAEGKWHESRAVGQEFYVNKLSKLDLQTMTTKEVNRSMKKSQKEAEEFANKYFDDWANLQLKNKKNG